jgi:hypothetical protein
MRCYGMAFNIQDGLEAAYILYNGGIAGQASEDRRTMEALASSRQRDRDQKIDTIKRNV